MKTLPSLSTKVGQIVGDPSPAVGVGHRVAPKVYELLNQAVEAGAVGPLPGAAEGFYRAEVKLRLSGVEAQAIGGVEFAGGAFASVAHGKIASSIEDALRLTMQRSGFTEFKVFSLYPIGGSQTVESYSLSLHLGGRLPGHS